MQTYNVGMNAVRPLHQDDERFQLVAPYQPAGDQPRAIAKLIEGFDAGLAAQTLLGVTGSGKTEAYLEAAARALQTDPSAQILILLPEIALTQAVIERITARFGVAPAEWHSGVAPPRPPQRRAEPGPAALRDAAAAVADCPDPELAAALSRLTLSFHADQRKA